MANERDSPFVGWLVWTGLVFFLGLLSALSFVFYRMTYAPQFNQPLFSVESVVGSAEAYSYQDRSWIPLKRGDPVSARSRIRSGEASQLDFFIPNRIRLRLKENSELEAKGFRSVNGKFVPRVRLTHGSLIAAAPVSLQGRTLVQFESSGLEIDVVQALFQLRHDSQADQTWLGVLGGSLEIRSRQIWNEATLILNDLERVEYSSRGLGSPAAISTEEWNELREAYELIQRSSTFEVEQFHLSKEAGNFFFYVFDHGAFYSPRVSYVNREFIFDSTEERVFLEVGYDVFPKSTIAGVYFKTRGLDFSKFRALEFEVRRSPQRSFPDAFRIELKSSEGIVQAFSQRNFEPDWKKVALPFRASKTTFVTEMTFVFAHDTVGIHKKGALQFRNFNLLPVLTLAPPKSSKEPQLKA